MFVFHDFFVEKANFRITVVFDSCFFFFFFFLFFIYLKGKKNEVSSNHTLCQWNIIGT